MSEEVSCLKASESVVRVRQLAGVLEGQDASCILATLERWSVCTRGCPVAFGFDAAEGGRCGALVWSGAWERCTWSAVGGSDLCVGCSLQGCPELSRDRRESGKKWRARSGLRGAGLGALARKACVGAPEVLAEMLARGEDVSAAEACVVRELAPREQRGRPKAPSPELCEEPSPDVFAELARELSPEQEQEQEQEQEAQCAAAPRASAQAEKEAKQAEKEAKQAEKQAEKQAKQAEKQAEKEAKQAEKEAKQAEKEAKQAEKEQAKQAKQAEKEQARQAKQAEKEQAKQAKQAPKKQAPKKQPPSEQFLAPEELLPEPLSDEESAAGADESVEVAPFEHAGQRWLRDGQGALYDPETHDEVARWDPLSQQAVPLDA